MHSDCGKCLAVDFAVNVLNKCSNNYGHLDDKKLSHFAQKSGSVFGCVKTDSAFGRRNSTVGTKSRMIR